MGAWLRMFVFGKWGRLGWSVESHLPAFCKQLLLVRFLQLDRLWMSVGRFGGSGGYRWAGTVLPGGSSTEFVGSSYLACNRKHRLKGSSGKPVISTQVRPCIRMLAHTLLLENTPMPLIVSFGLADDLRCKAPHKTILLKYCVIQNSERTMQQSWIIEGRQWTVGKQDDWCGILWMMLFWF